ncbi:DUF3047 domain-containing protein [bacterium]|nr:MAG: DUF3047 domain-containing protein [bacterium]
MIKTLFNALLSTRLVRGAENPFRLLQAIIFLLCVTGFFADVLLAASTDGVIRIPIVISGEAQKAKIGDWKVKEWKGKADVTVVDTEAGSALHLKSESTSIAVYNEGVIDIASHPYLNWSWLVKKLPKGGDVRKRNMDDQAIQLYVIFPYKWPASINSRLIGYIWDTSAKAGAELTSTKTSNTKYIVIKSGVDGLGKWHAEERNVIEDYKRLFKEEAHLASGVSVMIDSDDTKSSAESFIADVFFASEAKQSK